MNRYVDKILWMALFGLLCLSLFRLFTLTWTELLRLLLLTLGLLSVSVKTRKDSFSSFSAYLPVLFAGLFMFVIIQFDPATSAIRILVPQNQSYLFFLSSSGLVLMAGVAALVRGTLRAKTQKAKKKKLRHSISLFDKIAILVCAGSIALSLVSQSIFKIAPRGWPAYIGEVKLIECLVIWFVVTRSTPVQRASPSDTSQSHQAVHPGFRWSMRIACLIFCIIIIGGTGQSVMVFNSVSRAHSLYEGDELEHAKRNYRRTQSLNRFLSIKAVQDKCTDRTAVIYLRQDSTAIAEHILAPMRENSDDSLATYRRIGDIYFEAGRWTEAMAHYNYSLRSMKIRELVLDNLVLCHVKLENMQGLSNLLSHRDYIIDLEPVDHQSALMIGRYYLLQERAEDALHHFHAAERFEPDWF